MQEQPFPPLSEACEMGLRSTPRSLVASCVVARFVGFEQRARGSLLALVRSSNEPAEGSAELVPGSRLAEPARVVARFLRATLRVCTTLRHPWLRVVLSRLRTNAAARVERGRRARQLAASGATEWWCAGTPPRAPAAPRQNRWRWCCRRASTGTLPVRSLLRR